MKSLDAFVQLLEVFEGDEQDFRHMRPDADRVHNDGFWFVDLNSHRTLVLLHFSEGLAEFVWLGNHADYERIFKNNKSEIESWLRARFYIE